MKHLSQFIKEMRSKRKGLEEGGVKVLQRRGRTYADTARQVIRATLLPLQPPDTEPKNWSILVNRIAALLTLRFFEQGVILGYKLDDMESAGELADRFNEIPKDFIREWIEAGLRGESDGKRIDDEDIERISQDLDFKVDQLWYFTNAGPGDSAGMEQAVIDFMDKRIGIQLEDYSQAILVSLSQALTPIAKRDIREFVRRTLD